MSKEELEARVRRCIAKKQEGDSWDFKKKWYEGEKGKIDLLHDILCMSNLTTEENGIIIIGVDEEMDFSLCDVSSDPNRKNTQKMVTFLRDKPFDGGVRPTVYVETILISRVTLDVIVIENTDNVPYYVTNDFMGNVKAYHIYTRVGDTNTPVDRSADRNKVEALWKKRFGIDKPTIERFKVYLQDYTHWKSIDGQQSWYYEFAPEFKIETKIDEGADAYNYYCFTQLNPRPRYHVLLLKYHSTIMVDTRAVALDGGRFMTAVPNVHVFGNIPFYYYETDTINYSLHKFFEHRSYGDYSSNYMFESWNLCVPAIGTREEAKAFFEWTTGKDYPIETDRRIPSIPGILENGEDGTRYREEYKQAMIVIDMLERYWNEGLNSETNPKGDIII